MQLPGQHVSIRYTHWEAALSPASALAAEEDAGGHSLMSGSFAKGPHTLQGRHEPLLSKTCPKFGQDPGPDSH